MNKNNQIQSHLQFSLKKRLLLVWLLLFSALAFAQNKTVSGHVFDVSGQPLVGVSVRIENSTIGTFTDEKGSFSLNAKVKDNLNFSFMGMQPQHVIVSKNANNMHIVMQEDVLQLGEAVAIAYGVVKKRDVTGSIVTVKGDQINTTPTQNPVSALQGKVPGLNVISSGGAGSTPNIQIRGIGTLNASSSPLYVVDGMLVDNIDFVNMNDVVSIEVLKDPSSLAMFGVQGANGVILITTGRAKKGHLSASYNGYAGMQYLFGRDRLHLTNASQFTDLYNEKLMNEYSDAKRDAINGNLPIPKAPDKWVPDLLGKGTDWQSEIMRPAFITSHAITISKSSEKSTSLFSLGYYKQDGIVKYDSFNRFNARYSGDYKLTRHLKVGGNANLSKWQSTPPTASVQNASKALPTYSPYAPQTDWNNDNIGTHFTPSPSIQKDVPNPVAAMEIPKGTTESYGYRVVGNIYADISFLKDFDFKATGYYDVGTSFGSTYYPRFDVNNKDSNSSHKREVSSFSRNTSEYAKYQGDFILNYKKKFDKHSLDVMLGYTAYEKTSKGFSAGADSINNNEWYSIPDFWSLNMGSDINRSNGDSYDSEAFISYMGRVSYSYADKYLLTATFRVDGSSKFSPSKRWGYFPSFGAGWIVSDEKFMKPLSDKINFLKLRASWGQLGNDKIGNYLYFRKVNPKGQQVVIDGKTYYIPTIDGVVDPNIHWEVMSGLDLGLESYFFKKRLGFEFGYYTKTTHDLLAYVAPPISVGAGYAITNAGSIRNRGIEFTLSWADKINDFKYGVSFNGATNANRVLSLGDNNADITSDAYHRTAVGHSVGAFYGYVQDGVFQTDQEAAAYYPASWKSYAGDIRYKDLNGDHKIDEKDRTFIGSPLPTFTYGFSVNLAYKNFDFNMDFNGVTGNQILTTKRLPTSSQFNYYETDLSRWHGPGTSNKNPILNSSRSQNFLPSTNLLESGSYLRLRGIQFGYSVPKRVLDVLHLTKLRFYVNAENLLTLKKNTGYTPEIGGSILTGGIDDGSTYPLPTTFTGGIILNF